MLFVCMYAVYIRVLPKNNSLKDGIFNSQKPSEHNYHNEKQGRCGIWFSKGKICYHGTQQESC